MIEQQDLYVNTGEFEKVCPFPIGYIYLSTSSTSPATIYGGTWTALTDSKFLRPSGSWNSTGGSQKISVNQMPSHTHKVYWYNSATGGRGDTAWNNGGNKWQPTTDGWDGKGGSNDGLIAVATGGGSDYWQPYRTCYGWYRTA